MRMGLDVRPPFFSFQSTAYCPAVYSNNRILRRHAYTSCVPPSTIRIVRPLSPSFVPSPYSPPFPLRSDPNERAHFWLPSPPSPPPSPSTAPTSLLDSLVSSRMYIDQGEILRVRVEADQFCDDEPGPQKFVEGVGAEAKGRVRAPYNVIVCSFFFAVFCLRGRLMEI